ncbi:hypothetical protein D1AOALGA4SA_3855 [Olavius algarvensis Delta 1 endosymbiont]|nr:hypothetical protein D1AOALGA4SA_3855 [Olavius algarvensis Delta 1 endosymbiont]
MLDFPSKRIDDICTSNSVAISSTNLHSGAICDIQDITTGHNPQL